MSRWKLFPTIITPYTIVLFMGATLLSGCVTSETRWVHTEIPAEEWGVDAAQCKWEARRKAERDANENSQYATDEAFDDAQSIDSMFAREDLEKQSRVLFARCMKSLGYNAAD
ncbi:MAG: hypothetical protein HQ501_10435 [Rhodospirillales bacterium]|nr:hypothetical protein [Rhodospirillales bacterium]